MCYSSHLLNITRVEKYYSESDIFNLCFDTFNDQLSLVQEKIAEHYDIEELKKYKQNLNNIYKKAYYLNIPMQKKYSEEWFNVYQNGGVCYKDLNGEYIDLSKPMSTLSSNLDNILFADKTKVKHLPLGCVINAYEYAGLGFNNYDYYINSRKAKAIKVTSKYSIDIDDSYPSKKEINTFLKDVHSYNIYPSILYTPNGFHIDFYTNIQYVNNAVEIFEETATLLCRYVYKFFHKKIDISCTQINRISPMPFTFRIDNDNLYFLVPELSAYPKFNSAFSMHDFFDKLKLDNSLPLLEEIIQYKKHKQIENEQKFEDFYTNEDSKVFEYIKKNKKEVLISITDYEDIKQIGNNFVLHFLTARQEKQLNKKGAVVINSIFRHDLHPSLMIFKRNDEYVMFDYKFSNANEAETIYGMFAKINNCSYRNAIDYILQVEGYKFEKHVEKKNFVFSERTQYIMNLLKPCFAKYDKFLLHACYLELMFMARKEYKVPTDNWIPFSTMYVKVKSKMYKSSSENVQKALDSISKCDRQTIQNIQSLFKITRVLYIKNCSELQQFEFNLRNSAKEEMPNALKFIPINFYRENLIKTMVKCIVIANENLHKLQPRAVDIFTRYRSWGKIEEIILTIYEYVDFQIENIEQQICILDIPEVCKVFHTRHYIKKVFVEKLQI